MFLHPRVVLKPAVAVVTSLLLASSAFAASFDVNLSLATLPSAQGWIYVPSGAHAGVVESSVFSVAGGALTQNTMGQSNGVAGGSIFYQVTGPVTAGEAKQIIARLCCTQVEGSANATLGQGGFVFGFTTGSTQYDFGITDTRVFILQPGGTTVLAGTFDNSSAFHDFLFDWTSNASYRLYRDGVLLGTFANGFAVAANRLFFGDGTGGANANGQITKLEFLQGGATAARKTSWGRLKGLYH